MISTPSTHTRRALRWGLVALVVLFAAIVFSGCGNPTPVGLSGSAMRTLGKEMVAVERLGSADAADQYARELNRPANSKDQEKRARARFLRGYAYEFRETAFIKDADERDYSDARREYEAGTKGAKSGYGTQSLYRLGVLGANRLLGDPDSERVAINNLRLLTTGYDARIQLWVRTPEVAGEGGAASIAPAAPGAPVLETRNAADVATKRLDDVYRTSQGRNATYYRIVAAFVGFFERTISTSYGAAIALIVLALLVKIITTPFTTMAFRGMRDMQRIQPMIKELQEKYKGDREKQAQEQMRIMKEHKVSPLGGCFPMLIQIPVFIVVYQAVYVYAYGFQHAEFLWITNLGRPDLPLLILYAISMIVTQKLTATPATDPQQKMMQQQMTYFMPIFLVMVLMTMASAFVLYWFFLNVFSALHQYYLMRQFAAEDAAKGIQPAVIDAAPEPRKKGKQ